MSKEISRTISENAPNLVTLVFAIVVAISFPMLLPKMESNVDFKLKIKLSVFNGSQNVTKDINKVVVLCVYIHKKFK
jgi:hypothetical protein